MQPDLFKLEAFFERFEHVQGMNVLGASDVEHWTVDDLLKMSNGLDLGSISLGYEEAMGRPSLRQAIADTYPKGNLSAENVLITNGASEAILLAMNVSLKPGTTALVCRPVYQGLYEMAKTAGANVIRYDYRAGAGFAPDLDQIKHQLHQSPPDLLLLNSPHNPTGQVLAEADLKDLLERARDAGTRVVVDEVFHGIWINHKPVPSAINLDSNAVVMGCLSKVYGLGGLRIGWLAGPADFIKSCKELRYYTSLAGAAVVQQLGEVAIAQRKLLMKRGQENVKQNFDAASEWLDSHKQFFDYVPPQGGTVMLIKLKPDVDTKNFTEILALNHNVFLLPCAWTFDMSEGYLRLGLGGNPNTFAQGLSVIDSYLANEGWKH